MSTPSQRATDRLARAQAGLAKVEGPYLDGRRAVKLVLLFLGLAAALGGLWTFITTVAIESDPLFGGHADIFCPDVCDGCVGRYARQETTTIRGSAAVTDDLFCLDAERHRRRLPGGIWFVGLTAMVAAMPVCLMVVLLLMVVGRRGHLARRRGWQEAIAGAERDLAAASKPER